MKKDHQPNPATQQAPKANIQSNIPQPVITTNNNNLNLSNKHQTDLLGEKHETTSASSNTIKIDHTNLLG